MSQIVDQRLFELVQLVSVSGSSPIEIESRRRCSLRSSSRQSPGLLTRAQARQIVSFAASPCGRLVVFAASSLASETGDGHSNGHSESAYSDTRPFIGAALLTKADESRVQASNCDPNKIGSQEAIEVDVQWLPWFQDVSYRPSCATLSPECDFCLIGCENGSVFIISTKTLCPGFDPKLEKDLNHKDWSNKRTHRVFPLGTGAELKGI